MPSETVCDARPREPLIGPQAGATGLARVPSEKAAGVNAMGAEVREGGASMKIEIRRVENTRLTYECTPTKCLP